MIRQHEAEQALPKDWEQHFARLAEIFADPVKFVALCWPHLRLYDKQVEILYSLRDNDETVVPAGNELGKDFTTGLAVVWFFCSRTPCHIVTSSSGQTQLKAVLWGEIRRFVTTSAIPLPIQLNHLMARQVFNGEVDPRSYILGIVTNVPENLQGHHLARGPNRDRQAEAVLPNGGGKRLYDSDELPLPHRPEELLRYGLDVGDPSRPRTLAVFDEASGIDTPYYDAVDTWAHRKLIIGNPLPCTNFFFKAVKGGDIPSDTRPGFFYRKVIRIRADDSPNVRLAKKQEAMGKKVTNEIIIPGVINYDTYRKRRRLWDPIRQCIGLDGEFYEGAEVWLYPTEWRLRAIDIARKLKDQKKRRVAKAMGIDGAEGGDDTVFTVIDELGILEQIAKKTEDTSEIIGYTKMLIRKWDLDPENVAFDRGGGGKQHADILRSEGLQVRTVGFGEGVTLPHYYRRMTRALRREQDELRHTYKNRRAEMYGIARFDLLDPVNEQGFGIPEEYEELHRQLALFPLLYDAEGRMYLPPKDKPNKNSKEQTLIDIMGCSPDESDSLMLAIYAMFTKPQKRKITAYA